MPFLTLFGVIAVSLMLAFYALEERAPAFVLCFAGACAASSLYGFLNGAWPFGVVELIWTGVAFGDGKLTRVVLRKTCLDPSDRPLVLEP